LTLDDIRGVFEHSPWVAERAWKQGPFGSAQDLHAAMVQVVKAAGRKEQLALVRAHPELAGSEAAQNKLTPDSASEQGRLGFTALSKKELLEMAELNRRYREKFGFPCIVALRLHSTKESVRAEMRRRLQNDAGTELDAALEQIGHITRGRLEKIFHG
jgi:OHCU decarboxylase